MNDKNLIIQKIPRYYYFCPWLWKAKAIAQYPNRVLLARDLFDDAHSNNHSLLVQGILEHEKSHCKRFQEVGYWFFRLQYAFSCKFRLQEELTADTARFIFLKKHGGTIDLEKRAKLLSGSLYLWMVSYDKALVLLTELWKSA